MTTRIANAPCSWGVDDPQRSDLPAVEKVLSEAKLAGYDSIELGPWSYLPTDSKILTSILKEHQLSIVAGTIFDDLVSESNHEKLIALTHNICKNLSAIPVAQKVGAGRYAPPYLVIIDFGNQERARYAGNSAKAPRLTASEWQTMIHHIKEICSLAWNEYGVRPVIHPHAGGYIEFADEISRLVADISDETAGLCLDTGHLYYSGMDPVSLLTQYFNRLDYIHFKDINETVHKDVLERGVDFFSACAEGVMCPIGKGAIDYPAIKQLLDSFNYQGWVTIEQERDPQQAENSLRDVTESLQYLQSCGF